MLIGASNGWVTLPIASTILPIAYCLLPIPLSTYCLLLIAYPTILPIAYCLLPIAYPTILPIAYCSIQ